MSFAALAIRHSRAAMLVTIALMKHTGTTASHPIVNEPIDTAWPKERQGS